MKVKKFVSFLLVALMVLGWMPALAEETVYTTLYSGEISSLNYLTTSTTSEFAVAANVIDTLVEYDCYGQMQPSLALEWEPSPDELTWTFKLREDATWVDAEGNMVAKVTAHDFVSSAKYILDAKNASSTAEVLYGVIKGAMEYYEGTKVGADPSLAMDWDTVGIKALDDYTLQYTLKTPTPYFLSMTTYVCFMPVYGPFLEAKGDEFGLATGTDTLLYCGAYVLSEFEPQQRRVLVKNESNWDAENVTIDRIVSKYNKEAKAISADLYLEGAVDSASIDNAVAADWLADPVKADYIRPVRQTSFYTYFYSFNFDPQFDEAYEPENWKKVVVNENFRKSIYYGLDRVKAMLVTDPDNASELVFNSFTPPNFVTLSGVDYVNIGALAEITALGTDTYNPDAALAYRDAAITELTAAGATFPVKILMPYNPNVNGNDQECQVVEQQLEELLGTDYIDIIIEAGPSQSFITNVRRSGKYALLKTNFGPDYADPLTYLDPFKVGNKYQFIDKNEDMTEFTTEMYAMIDAAKSVTSDIQARYEAFTEVEAFIVNHAIAIPFGYGSGGYTASRIDPFTQQFASYGISQERYKGAVMLDTPMNTDQYYDAYDKWLTEREALNAD